MTKLHGTDLVRALETLITSRYGYLKYLVSDNGSQFISRIVRKYWEDHDINPSLQQYISPTGEFREKESPGAQEGTEGTAPGRQNWTVGKQIEQSTPSVPKQE